MQTLPLPRDTEKLFLIYPEQIPQEFQTSLNYEYMNLTSETISLGQNPIIYTS